MRTSVESARLREVRDAVFSAMRQDSYELTKPYKYDQRRVNNLLISEV
tara:strand:- start:1129 stop:1272 length:144 start_codon:yes stop_codon:yes gene_type:complete